MVQVNSHNLPRTIVDMADQALYYPKDHGRNQTCNYTDLVARSELNVTETNVDSIELF